MNFEIAPKSTEVKLNWDDAKLYCFSLNIEGKTGWRLPTAEELFWIYETTTEPTSNWKKIILVWSSTASDNPSDKCRIAIRFNSKFRLDYHDAVWNLAPSATLCVLPVRDIDIQNRACLC